MEKMYTMSVVDYVLSGRDGYDAMKDPAVEDITPDRDDAPTV